MILEQVVVEPVAAAGCHPREDNQHLRRTVVGSRDLAEMVDATLPKLGKPGLTKKKKFQTETLPTNNPLCNSVPMKQSH